MRNKPHILFITSWFPSDQSSAGTFVELHLLALQSRGCKCAVMLSGEATLGNFVRKQFDRKNFLPFRKRSDIHYVENLTVHSLPLKLESDSKAKRKKNILATTENTMRNYIAQHGKPDFIFHHGIFDYCYLTTYVRENFDIPVWYMENSPNLSKTDFPCANSFDNQESQMSFVRNANRRFAVTQAYVNRMGNLFNAPFEYCPNVITDDFFIDLEDIRKPKDSFQFINIAILDKRKNQKLILEAFALKFKGNSKYKLIIAGDGSLLETLRKKADDLGIASQCKILGFQSRKRIVELLDQSHCFVLSSYSETFGVVIIEAMARGIPAISSLIDGPNEIINDTNGYFFESDNSKDLGEKMEEMIVNYHSFNPEKIIQSVKERYGPDAVKNALFVNEEK